MNRKRFNLYLLAAPLIIVGAAVLYSLNASQMVFTDPDEARYVTIAKTMLDSGDWLVPRLSGEPYFDKPALFFWMLAGAFRFLGVTELAARLVSVIGAALLLWTTFQFGSLLFSTRVAIWSTLVLATSAFMLIAGRFVRMDVWLTAFVALALLFWARFYFIRASRANLILGYLCLGLALMTKGLIGVLVPAGVVGAFILYEKNWVSIRRSGILTGFAIVLAVAGPWYLYMCWQFPNYAMEFFYKHHFLRATTNTFGRSANPLYLPSVLLAGFLPWTAFLVVALLRALPIKINAAWPKNPRLRFCYWWIAFAIVPFCFTRTQLPVYTMPALPPLALILGHYLNRVLRGQRMQEIKWLTGITLVCMCVSLVALATVNWRSFNQTPFLILCRRLIVFGIVIWLAIAMIKRARVSSAMGILIAGTAALAADLAISEAPAFFAHASSHRFVEPLRAHMGAADLLVIGPESQYALPLYIDIPINFVYVSHNVDFLDYCDHPAPVLCLFTSTSLFDLAQSRMSKRLRLIDKRGELHLVKLMPREPKIIRPDSMTGEHDMRGTSVPPVARTMTFAETS